MNIGVTATREGLTAAQAEAFRKLLGSLMQGTPAVTYYLHQGDCVGGDAECSAIARELGCKIASHPPTIDRHRAFVPADVEMPPKPYLERNEDIVDQTEVLVAMPKGYEEEQRSGTWATIRYCHKKGRRPWVIWPDGNVQLY